jgi:hypothetical protein
MPGHARFIVAAVSLAALAACGRTAPASDAALQRDLDLAKGQGLELAPQGDARSTLSADELVPSGNRTKSTVQTASKAATPRRATPTQSEPKVAQRESPAIPAVAAPQSNDSVVAIAPATPRPSAAGAISPPPPGGYKTMGELIRKAPFPINP